MNGGPIVCGKCGVALPPDIWNSPGMTPCPGCGVWTRVAIFPALLRPYEPGRRGVNVLMDDEASCFYHPDKKAAVPCDSCGRFLCALCDVELAGRHLCPGCVETGAREGRLQNLEQQRFLYDSLAMFFGLLPIVITCSWPVWIITGPAAVFVAIRYWRRTSSILYRSRAWNVFAIILGLAQIAGWGTIVVAMAAF